jgi:hypothetical protein
MKVIPEQVKMKKTSTVRHRSLLASDTPMVQCRRTEKGVCSRQDTRNSLKGTGSSGNQTLMHAHMDAQTHSNLAKKKHEKPCAICETTRSSQINVKRAPSACVAAGIWIHCRSAVG